MMPYGVELPFCKPCDDRRPNRKHAVALASWLLMGLWSIAAQAATGVSEERVSLPEGPGSLEGIGENVDIDPNMGLMTHAVTIQVPEGYPAMTPGVALSYSSGAGGSVAGMGWSLSFPYIERLTKRGLPEYDREDEFSVGGGEELVLLPDSDPPVYRSRFEKSFTRYTWRDAGDGRQGYWVAEYPDGRSGYFGAGPDGTPVASARVGGANGTFRYHLVEMVDRYGHAIRYTYDLYGNVTLIRHIGWVFVEGAPVYEVTFEYEDRYDLLSDCKAGFNELLEVRLKQINVLARGQRIRRYALSYEDYASSGGFTRLTGVQLYGLQDGAYPIHETFEYSEALGVQCTDAQGCDRPYVTVMGSLGISLQQGAATLLDINGDSLPDVVDTSSPGQPHRFFINTLEADGGHHFAAASESAVAGQGGHDLSSPYVQVLDVNGDGFTDMLNAQTGDVLMNRGLGDWAEVVNIWDTGEGDIPDLQNDFDPSDGQLRTVRFLDYDGDKRIDLLRSQFSGSENVTVVFRNTGNGAFLEDAGVAQIEAGFETDNLELNDMNGDGLLDPVQVLQDRLRYRLNLGWGQWGDWVIVSGFDFTDQEAIQAELEDLNGDGISDLVLVAGNAVRYWINRNGESFDPEQTITSEDIEGDIPVREQTTTVLYADMNGNGSSDIVWINASGQVTYLELFPVRPNLMSRMENAIGRVVEVTYGTSVQHMARDGGPGAWPYALPHPMTVVNRLDQWDALTNVHQVTDYTYHDGYYNGVEKDFRGYEQVEHALQGDDSQQSGEVRERYDVGVTDTYFNGLLVTEEQFSDGRSLAVKTTEYEQCPVAEVPSTGLLFPVRNICKVGETTEHREGLSDVNEWRTTQTRWVYDGYGNVVLTSDLGVTAEGGGGCPACTATGYTATPCGPQCLGDESYSSVQYALPQDNDGRWILSRPVRERSYGVANAQREPANGTYTEKLSYYDGEAFTGLPLGQVTHGTLSRQTERVDTSGQLRTTTRNRLDEHGNVIESIDPIGTLGGTDHRRIYTMDEEGLKIVRVDILLNGADGPYRLRQEIQYDPLWAKPVESTAWMVTVDDTPVDARNSTFYVYDEFARLISMIRPGDTMEAPSEVYSFDLGNPASRIVLERRSQVGGPLDLQIVQCFDGHGRMYQERMREADDAYQVTGFTVFNRQNEKREVYQPYEATSGQCDVTPPAGTQSVVTTYDAISRPILEVYPEADEDDGLAQARTVYLPLAVAQYDLEDTRAGGPYSDTPGIQRKNGLGKLIATERYLTAGGPAQVQRFRYDELGRLAATIDPAGNEHRQQYDLLGRLLQVDDPDSGATTFAYDAAGNQIRRQDALGVTTLRSYDGTNRVIAQWNEQDETASRVESRYDVRGDCPADRCTNLAGQIAGVRYPLGDGTFGDDRFGYTLRGHVAYSARAVHGRLFEFESQYDNAERLVGNTYPTGLHVDIELDGKGRVTAVPGYIDAMSYDDRGQTDELRLANGVVTQWTYDERMRLAGATATGPDDGLILAYGYTRDRVGNLVEISDGRADDATPLGGARYIYDSLYRLTQAELDAGRTDHAETLTYEYDEADRILSKTSSRGAASAEHVGDYEYGQDAGPHAVTHAGDMDFAYDAAGQMTARGDVTYAWDHLGRLVRAADGTGPLATFLYGPSTDRVVKREGSSTVYFLNDDFEVRDGVAVTYIRVGGRRVVKIEQPSYVAQMLSDIAPATGSDAALTAVPDGLISAGDAWMAQAVAADVLSFAAPTVTSDVEALLAASNDRLLNGIADHVSYLHHDHLGGTVAVSDDAGRVTARTEYYPYGMVRFRAGEGEDYDYTGKEQDDSTGLTYFGARYYDAWTGRWTAPDMAFRVQTEQMLEEQPEEISWAYAFNGGNPVNTRDDDGTLTSWRIPILGGLAGSIIHGARILWSKARGNNTWVRPLTLRAQFGTFTGASNSSIRWNYFKKGFVNFLKGRSAFKDIYVNKFGLDHSRMMAGREGGWFTVTRDVVGAVNLSMERINPRMGESTYVSRFTKELLRIGETVERKAESMGMGRLFEHSEDFQKGTQENFQKGYGNIEQAKGPYGVYAKSGNELKDLVKKNEK